MGSAMGQQIKSILVYLFLKLSALKIICLQVQYSISGVLSFISAPAPVPAPAIYCHLKLYLS